MIFESSSSSFSFRNNSVISLNSSPEILRGRLGDEMIFPGRGAMNLSVHVYPAISSSSVEFSQLILKVFEGETTESEFSIEIFGAPGGVQSRW